MDPVGPIHRMAAGPADGGEPVKTLETAYEIVLHGQLDPPMLALIAEYDLGDTPAQVILHGLVVDRETLATFLDRAHALGVVVNRIRPVDRGGAPTADNAALAD
jgi:hypothetical protein